MRIAVAGGTGIVGRHVVASAEAAGHDVVMLTRSTGIDLMVGRGLPEAITGCDVVIDVTSPGSASTEESIDFFTAVTGNLLAAEKTAGVPHHVALSIVGAPGVESGHYAGKNAQEQLIVDSDRPWSILRTTQFHEFATQMTRRARSLGTLSVPQMRSQPIAAAEVGAALVDIAEGAPRGIDRELAGPREENMADMVRRYLAVMGDRSRVIEAPFPGDMGAAMASGRLLPGPDARLGVQSFDEWLHSPEARAT